MLDSLYTEALRKKGSIATDIEEMMDDKIDLDKNWTQIKVLQASNDFILAAGDGSFNQKKYLSFNLYAVAAESIIYNPNEDLKTVESVELDVIQHQSFVRERLRNMMSIFEIKTALKTINNFNPDYYMDDGSILGDLIRPIPTESTITPENKKQIANKIFTQIKTEDEISSFKFKEEFKELFEEIKDEDSLITYLETLEHLIALKNLLNHRDKIIAVSKTSTSNDLFHSNVPDMAILDKLTRAEGYSRPIYKKVNSEVKRDFPVFNEFFRDMWFTVFFTRLEDNKNIVKIELPYYANEEKIKEIIGILKSNATDGYPFLLKKAHHDVVIKHKDMENLSNILEIIDKSGREML